MLIGTAILSTIDILVKNSLFHSDRNTKVRNIGLVLCQYLQFAHDERESCRKNEAGWTKLVIQRAQEHGVPIEGFYGIDDVVKQLKVSTPGNSASASDAGRPPVGGSLNMVHAYESAPPLVGILTVEMFRAHEDGGTRRDWSKYNLTKEISAYRRHQMVKVGMRGPEDYGASTIGGKFYDLNAPRNRALVKQKLMESTSEVNDVDSDTEGTSQSEQ